MDIFSPIDSFASFLLYMIFQIEQGSYEGNVFHFFIYDAIKIGLLLLVINYFMAVVRYYLPIDRIKKFLTKGGMFGFEYMIAAFLGVITPFCSCSSIPLFIGFLRSGMPVGLAFTFLISSPLINESSLALFPALFGWKMTLLYNGIGIAISVIGGIVLEKLHAEKYINMSFLSGNNQKKNDAKKNMSLDKLLMIWWNEAMSITRSIYPYVLIGVAIGAVIHGFIPKELIERTLSNTGCWSVPIATLLGVPIYANSVSVIPIVEALVTKGVPMGTALAFMTATVTLSIPEAILLRKVMQWKLLGIFFGITTLGIILMGYIFNAL